MQRAQCFVGIHSACNSQQLLINNFVSRLVDRVYTIVCVAGKPIIGLSVRPLLFLTVYMYTCNTKKC